jgi:hypothetical protein
MNFRKKHSFSTWFIDKGVNLANDWPAWFSLSSLVDFFGTIFLITSSSQNNFKSYRWLCGSWNKFPKEGFRKYLPVFTEASKNFILNVLNERAAYIFV